MKIRLNKVQRELNVGLSTIVEFLQKKGFTSVVENPNTIISEEEYNLLIKEFSKDKSFRMESEKFIQERQGKDKVKAVADTETDEKTTEQPVKVDKVEKTIEEIVTVVPEIEVPKFKTVGKINLEEVNRTKKNEETPVEENEIPIVEDVKIEEVIVSVQPQVSVSEEPVQEEKIVEPEKVVEKEVESRKPEVEEKPKEILPVVEKIKEEEVTIPDEVKPEEPVKQEVKTDVEENTGKGETIEVQEKTEPAKDEVFEIDKPAFVSKINVVGQIDLNALNQSTRPKKKTKEEKRKDREDKDRLRQEQRQQLKDAIMKEIQKTPEATTATAAADDAKKKKKRSRINKERVDIYSEQRKPETTTAPATRQPSQNNNATQNSKPQSSQQFRDRQRKKNVRTEVSDEDVAKQVKETLARLTGAKGKTKTSKYRKEKRELAQERQHELEEQTMEESKVLKLTEFVTANELASLMNVPVTNVISTCMSIGIMVSINQRLDAETINLVAEEFGFETEYVSAEVAHVVDEEKDAEEDLKPRAPIVTVMGHVDHGKTSLLDYIRKSNVIAGEAGGITQHIGAYNVKLDDGRKITFLDTPGHEAFTAMRARGAQVTDIAIIIVAADDSIMPQTKEAINHAQAAGVPMVFAINKIDKPHADPEKIKEQLAQMNFLVEDWGGKYQSQDISAKQGTGVSELMEKVLLEAEMLDLKANPDRRAVGSIIESTLDKGRGYVATVLVSNGTLKMGDIVVAGTHWGKIKAMFNERNQRIKQALPSEPALILGLNGAPQAGDAFNVVETEREAREITVKREQLQREMGLRTQKLLTLDEVGRRIALGTFQQLNIIVKGDVDGSIEALSDSLIKLSTEHIQVNVIHKAVGQISESDVSLAAASNAIIIGFQVRPSISARKFAEQEGVDVRLYSIIYDAIEEVKLAMEGLLAPVVKEEVTATIEVREVFHITKVGTVAGAMVREGKVKRSDKARLIRDGIVIYTGEILALKRFKDDVKEVAVNFECGISLVNYDDIKIGDMIETYQQVEVKQTL